MTLTIATLFAMAYDIDYILYLTPFYCYSSEHMNWHLPLINMDEKTINP